MTEQYFEYKDGVCENINCPERKAKLHFKKLFEEKKDDRDNLYEQMQKIRNALEKKNLKENKTDVEWLAKENLKLLDEKTIAEERLKAMEEANKLEQQELEGLKSYREKTENEKKKQVEEYQSLPDKFKDLQKEVDEKVLELQRLEEKELTQLKILNEGKKEIENELNELREIQGKISKEKQNKKDLKKVKRINKLIAKAFKLKDMLRIDKVKKMQPKITKEFNKLAEEQKALVKEKYDEMLRI